MATRCPSIARPFAPFCTKPVPYEAPHLAGSLHVAETVACPISLSPWPRHLLLEIIAQRPQRGIFTALIRSSKEVPLQPACGSRGETAFGSATAFTVGAPSPAAAAHRGAGFRKESGALRRRRREEYQLTRAMSFGGVGVGALPGCKGAGAMGVQKCGPPGEARVRNKRRALHSSWSPWRSG